MRIPPFNQYGGVPPGVYRCTLREALDRFGQGSFQRRAVAARLERVYELVAKTGQIARFIVFGSFIAEKSDPNDVDIVVLMKDTFELDRQSGDVTVVLNHLEAQTRFGASVFWMRQCAAIGGEDSMIEYFQVRRSGGKRGIIEIVREVS